MNLAIWDIESSSASTDFGSIIEIGGVLVDENFKEKDRFNLRCRLPEGEIFQAMALIVNKTSIKKLTQAGVCPGVAIVFTAIVPASTISPSLSR